MLQFFCGPQQDPLYFLFYIKNRHKRLLKPDVKLLLCNFTLQQNLLDSFQVVSTYRRAELRASTTRTHFYTPQRYGTHTHTHYEHTLIEIG